MPHNSSSTTEPVCSTSSQSATFLSLPPEIRTIIYRKVFQQATLCRPRSRSSDLHPLLSLLFTNRLTYSEARDILYEEATFVLRPCDHMTVFDGTVLPSEESGIRAVIKHAKTVVYKPSPTHDESSWKYLSYFRDLSAVQIRFSSMCGSIRIKDDEDPWSWMRLVEWITLGLTQPVLDLRSSDTLFCCLGGNPQHWWDELDDKACSEWLKGLHTRVMGKMQLQEAFIEVDFTSTVTYAQRLLRSDPMYTSDDSDNSTWLRPPEVSRSTRRSKVTLTYTGCRLGCQKA